MHSEKQWDEHKYSVDVVFEMLTCDDEIGSLKIGNILWQVLKERPVQGTWPQRRNHQWDLGWLNSLEMMLPKERRAASAD